MRVAITGGSGFIGVNLVKYLRTTEPDTEIVIVDLVPPPISMFGKVKYVYADIRNLHSLLAPFEGCDEVYHLAGILGTSELFDVSSLACENNIVGASNVMDACLLAGVKRVYNVAKPHFDGFDENAYTLTKHAGELIGQLYRRRYGIPVATVRWLNAVGPYQHLYPVRKFLPMMILQAMYGYNLEVYGDGTQTIDPIDVEDLSRFTVHAIRNLGEHDCVVDLGSGKAISCQEAAETILDVVRSSGGAPQANRSTVVNVPMRDGEKPGVSLVADMSYWTSVGMETKVPFSESIRKTYDYIRSLPDWHRLNALRFYGFDV